MKVEKMFRPIDLARAAGLSPQTVRKYEEWGFLPPAERSPSGYRRYTERHMHAIRTARVLAAGYGWEPSLQVMQRVHRGELDAALALVDGRHAQLDYSRREVEVARDALRALAEHGVDLRIPRTRAGEPRKLQVGEAAAQVGVRVSALRFWEEQGLLQPERDPANGYRLYNPDEVCKLQVVALLRKAGYGFAAIETVLAELAAGRLDQALHAVERRLQEIAEASRRCWHATAALWVYVETHSNPSSEEMV